MPSQVTVMPAAPSSTMATVLFVASPVMRSVLPIFVTVQLGHQRLSSSSRRRIAFRVAVRLRAIRCENMMSPHETGKREHDDERGGRGPPAPTESSGGFGTGQGSHRGPRERSPRTINGAQIELPRAQRNSQREGV